MNTVTKLYMIFVLTKKFSSLLVRFLQYIYFQCVTRAFLLLFIHTPYLKRWVFLWTQEHNDIIFVSENLFFCSFVSISCSLDAGELSRSDWGVLHHTTSRLRRLTLLAHMRGLRRSPTLGGELWYLRRSFDTIIFCFRHKKHNFFSLDIRT